MAENDWAIVVGINGYPKLGDLSGSENNAHAFHEWLIDPAGGDVPAKQAQLILTSNWKTPFRSVGQAKPDSGKIQGAVEKLQDIADRNIERGLDPRVGRRLYLYMAGHGFSPRPDQTGLLMANATRLRTGTVFHVLGEYNADWFYRAGYFDEIVLIMDCCREIFTAPALNMPYRDVIAQDFTDRVKRFYAFATKWSRLAYDVQRDGEPAKGVFTTAVLAGLRGAATEAGTNQITTDSLRRYLRNNLRDFMTPELLANPDVPKEPDVQSPDASFVLATVAVAPVSPVNIMLPPDAVDKEAQVLGADFKPVLRAVPGVTPWVVNLPRGLYIVLVLAQGLQSSPFEVTGTGGLDVRF